MSPILPSQIAAVVSDPTASLCGNFKNTLLRFPALFSAWFNWMFDSGGSVTNAFKREIRYTGDYIFAASPLLEDASRLLCNGQAIVRADYPELFTLIGTTYGVGNGSTTFNLPDFRDRFPIGVSGTKILASTGGAASNDVTLIEAQIPKHRHYFNTEQNGGSSYLPDQTSENGQLRVGAGTAVSFINTAGTKVGQTRDFGSGTPGTQSPISIPTIPPYLACYVYIAT